MESATDWILVPRVGKIGTLPLSSSSGRNVAKLSCCVVLIATTTMIRNFSASPPHASRDSISRSNSGSSRPRATAG
jgi:hypothetical protein